MEIRVDSDTFFVFSILFIAALALCVFAYILFPYLSRKKHLGKIKFRYDKKVDHYGRVDQKYAELKISSLEEKNQQLQINLKNDLQEILQSNSKASDLMNFYANFEKIYPDFSGSLQKLVPSITANELNLCAFLRLSLSSKEVSQLLNITPESVNKARYRLRKKLQLKSNDDFFTFLLNI